eukprot:2633376-Prymnesium_polylepis.1
MLVYLQSCPRNWRRSPGVSPLCQPPGADAGRPPHPTLRKGHSKLVTFLPGLPEERYGLWPMVRREAVSSATRALRCALAR